MMIVIDKLILNIQIGKIVFKADFCSQMISAVNLYCLLKQECEVVDRVPGYRRIVFWN